MMISFAVSVGFGIASLCIHSAESFLGMLLSLAFLAASILGCLPRLEKKETNQSKSEGIIEEEKDTVIYGHPEGNIIKRV